MTIGSVHPKPRKRLVTALFPLRSPQVAKLPDVTAFSTPLASRVVLPLLSEPETSIDLTCQTPSTLRLEIRWPLPDVENHADKLRSGLTVGPNVISLFKPLKFPAAIGNSYRERARDGDLETPTQLPFMPSEEDLTKECIHGLTRAWCDICSSKLSQPKPRRERATPLQLVDLLDLILPLLQPPLGENFDNVVSFPPGTRLYPFQPEGVRFLAEQNSALLGDEMGLGKSIQAIIALRILFRTGTVRNVLLLCPKSVVTDWDKKLWVWSPKLRVVPGAGIQATAISALAVA